MERSDQLDQIAAALSKAQASVRAAEKTRVNPAFRSRYATLSDIWDACREALHANGLAVVQTPEPAPDGHLMLTTLLLHESGQFLGGTILIPLAKQDPQGYGSALTYARRYGLAAVVGVAPDEDDDGAAASPRQGPPEERRPAAGPAQAPETRGDAIASGQPCPRCHAPAGKPHGKPCQASSGGHAQ